MSSGDDEARLNQGFDSSMMFSLDHDTGASICAYLIPDSGGTIPVLKVRSEGATLLTLEANVTRPELVAAGRHSSGQCGFLIDETLITNLASYEDLELLEASSGIIIFRRPRPTFIEDKVFRLETHLLPLWRIDETLRGYFQYWYKGIDRQGLETSTQVFCLNNAVSTYISGRLLITNYLYFLSKGFKTVAMFRDPYEELAERLILLKSASPQTREVLGPRDTMTFEVVIEALGEMEAFDKASCKRFFRRASGPVFAALSNPYVRLLTASTPDEMPGKACMSTALQLLAEFDVLALRADAAHFSEGLTDLLGLAPGVVPVVKEYSRVIELANILRENHDAELILEKDLELYGHAASAFGTLTQQTSTIGA